MNEMDISEPKVIRIVNLDKNTTNQALKLLLKEQLYLRGNIKRTYIRQDNKLSLVFAYVIFEFSCDAKIAVKELNGFQYESVQLDVAVIGPNSSYKQYIPLTEKLQPLKVYKGRNSISTGKTHSSIAEFTRLPLNIPTISGNGCKNYPYRKPLNSLAFNTLAKTNMNLLEDEKSLDSNYKKYEAREKTTAFFRPLRQYVKTFDNDTVKRSLIEATNSNNENKNKQSKLNLKRDGNEKKTTPKLATNTSEKTIKNVSEKIVSTSGKTDKSKLNQGRDGNAKNTILKSANKSEHTNKNIPKKTESAAEENSKLNMGREGNARKTTPKLVTKSENTNINYPEKNASAAEGNSKLHQGRGGNARKTTPKLVTKSENTNINYPEKNASAAQGNSKLNLGRGGNARKTTPKLVTKSENTNINYPEKNASAAEGNSKLHQGRGGNARKTTPKLVTKSENTNINYPEKNASAAQGNSKLNQGRGGNARKTTPKLVTKSENTNINYPEKNASAAEGNSKLNQSRGRNARKTTSKLVTKLENTNKNYPENTASTAYTLSKSVAKTDNGLRTHKSMRKSSTQSKELLNIHKNNLSYHELLKSYLAKVGQTRKENNPSTTKEYLRI